MCELDQSNTASVNQRERTSVSFFQLCVFYSILRVGEICGRYTDAYTEPPRALQIITDNVSVQTVLYEQVMSSMSSQMTVTTHSPNEDCQKAICN